MNQLLFPPSRISAGSTRISTSAAAPAPRLRQANTDGLPMADGRWPRLDPQDPARRGEATESPGSPPAAKEEHLDRGAVLAQPRPHTKLAARKPF